MTMSKEHICFRMLCFHVSQARFTVSFEKFMTVSFLTYDVVRSYENDREHVAASEGIPQSLQPDGGLCLSAGPIQFCGWVPIRQRGTVHLVHCIVATMDWSAPPTRSCHYVTRCSPSPYFSPVHNTSVFGLHITTDDVARSFVVLCAEIPKYKTTAERSFIFFMYHRSSCV